MTSKVLYWVCRSCSGNCILLYNGIEPTDGIENCVTHEPDVTPKWRLEEHDDVPVSQLLEHYLPRPDGVNV